MVPVTERSSRPGRAEVRRELLSDETANRPVRTEVRQELVSPDQSLVSEVTNPTYFKEKKKAVDITPDRIKVSRDDDHFGFDATNAFPSVADPIKTIKSDEFSDPFFTADPALDHLEAKDPGLDHLDMSDDDDEKKEDDFRSSTPLEEPPHIPRQRGLLPRTNTTSDTERANPNTVYAPQVSYGSAPPSPAAASSPRASRSSPRARHGSASASPIRASPRSSPRSTPNRTIEARRRPSPSPVRNPLPSPSESTRSGVKYSPRSFQRQNPRRNSMKSIESKEMRETLTEVRNITQTYEKKQVEKVKKQTPVFTRSSQNETSKPTSTPESTPTRRKGPRKRLGRSTPSPVPASSSVAPSSESQPSTGSPAVARVNRMAYHRRQISAASGHESPSLDDTEDSSSKPRTSPVPSSMTERLRQRQQKFRGAERTENASPVPAAPSATDRLRRQQQKSRGIESTENAQNAKVLANYRGRYNQAPSPPPAPPKQKSTKPRSKKIVVTNDLRQVTSDETPYSLNEKTTNDSSSLSSVGSDIRRLRSILRRSRLNKNTERIHYVEPLQSAFAVYDEKSNDPMQRAGLRLLSAAVIPIQCLARKHMALREALTRMWAIVVIQACARRWLAMKTFDEKRSAALTIQRVHRGGCVRDRLLLEQCCAIEIQRHARGLLATLDVYEKIYKITMIQSSVRKFLAMNKAMDTMVSIIQIQSVIRMFLARNKFKAKRAAAVKIQTSYRCYSTRFNYQLDLLDIIISQSMWRRKIATRQVNSIRTTQRAKAATLIQSHWRAYDCSMNYLHFLADVLITQSAARRWFARREIYAMREDTVTKLQSFGRMCVAKRAAKKIRSAILLQKTWRGFVNFADYMFTIADIVILQSLARRFIAKRNATRRRDIRADCAVRSIQKMTRSAQAKNRRAATTIQAGWRSYVAETEYAWARHENQSATVIQTCWRRFLHFSNFIISLDSAITLQAAFRGYQARRGKRTAVESAKCIQRESRSFLARRQTREETRAGLIEMQGSSLQTRDHRAATSIQARFRGVSTRDSTLEYLSARKIQRVWRGMQSRTATFEDLICASSLMIRSDNEYYARKLQAKGHTLNVRNNFVRYVAVRKIQSSWRGYTVRAAYTEFLAAKTIQRHARAFVARSMFVHYVSARSIQKTWRGFVVRALYTDYVAARTIQKYCRGYLVRSSVGTYNSARTIQKWWRGTIIRSSFKYFLAARFIQRGWRRSEARSAFRQSRATETIQRVWRGHVARSATEQHLAARSIQSQWRGLAVRNSVGIFLAARAIQRVWRGAVVRRDFNIYVAARAIQRLWRGAVVRSGFNYFVAARCIQSNWRAAQDRGAYRQYTSARRIQSMVRGTQSRGAVRLFLVVRCIQTAWRGYAMRSSYVEFLAARKIQSIVRQRQVRKRFVKLRAWVLVKTISSAIVVQRVFRGQRTRQQVPTFMVWYEKNSKTYKAASAIQKLVRGHHSRLQYWELLGSAIQIQRIFRGHSARVFIARELATREVARRYKEAAMKVQAVARGMQVRYAFRTIGAAVQIQAMCRGMLTRLAFRRSRATVQIQAQYRSHRTRCAFQDLIEAIIVVQSVIRGFLGKLSASKIRDLEISAAQSDFTVTIPEECEEDIVTRAMRVDNAARTLQRFFLWVKAEVDREVRNAKKRKKSRRKQRHHKSDDQDRLLETVWASSFDFGSEKIRQAEAAAAYELSSPRSRSNGVDRNARVPELYKTFPETLLFQSKKVDDDRVSDISSTVHNRIPRPRREFSRSQRDDDFDLEEAWIDTEIVNAKERRRAEKEASKHRRSKTRRPVS